MWTELCMPVHTPEKRRVIELIEELRPEIDALKLSQATGMPLASTTAQLNTVAAEVGAHMRVGSAGSITYVFNEPIKSAYLRVASMRGFKSLARIIWNCCSFVLQLLFAVCTVLFRLSIGIILVASVVIGIVLIIVALLKASDGGGGGGGGGGSSGGDLSGLGDVFSGASGAGSAIASTSWSNSWGWSIFDLFWPRHYWYWNNYHYDDFSYGRNDGFLTAQPANTGYYGGGSTAGSGSRPVESAQTNEKKMGFLDACFSFVFGEANPNIALEEQRWQLIASAIKESGGVVCAEHIAPYLETVNSDDEDWMLPVLSRFQGQPQVTEQGQIIYLFPTFVPQVKPLAALPQSGSECESRTDCGSIYRDYLERKRRAVVAPVQHHVSRKLSGILEEQEVPFTQAPATSVAQVVAFALFNLVLSLWLFTHMNVYPVLHAFSWLIIFMFSYAVMFFSIPLIRGFANALVNGRIAARNERRKEAAQRLVLPDAALAEKLRAAQEQGRELLIAAMPETIVYSTERSDLEQQFDGIESKHCNSKASDMVMFHNNP